MAVQIFESGDYAVSALLAKGAIGFRAADVTRTLGFANSSQAVRKTVRSKHVSTLEALQGSTSTGVGGISTGERGISTG